MLMLICFDMAIRNGNNMGYPKVHMKWLSAMAYETKILRVA